MMLEFPGGVTVVVEKITWGQSDDIISLPGIESPCHRAEIINVI